MRLKRRIERLADLKTDPNPRAMAIGMLTGVVLIFKRVVRRIMFRKVTMKKIATLSAVILGLSTQVAQADSLVFLEMFGRNTCTYDDAAQEMLLDVLRERQDIVMINCRNTFGGPGEIKFTHKFCEDRAKKYSDSMRLGGVKTPMIIANGRWDASIRDVTPAINLAKTDNVQAIEIVRDTALDVLNIDVPGLELDPDEVHKGKLLIYAMAPTQGTERFVADPDLELTKEIREKVNNNQSVPFVTKVRMSQFFLRPVIAMGEIASWSGTPLHITYPLSDINRLAGSLEKDLSYVVVLHRDNETGPVLAVGQVLSVAEMRAVMLSSETVEIEQLSVPVDY